MKSNKKANWIDYIYVVVIIFALAIGVVVGKLIINEIDLQYQNDSNMPTEAKTTISTINTNYVGLWDNIFTFFMVGVFTALIISAYFIKSHPIFFFIMIFIVIIMALLTTMFGDVFNEMMSTQELSGYASSFPKLSWIMGIRFPIIMFIFGIILGIVFYVKGDQY